MSKDTSLFMAWVRGELSFEQYIAAEDAVDPVTAAAASAVVPAPLWWLELPGIPPRVTQSTLKAA